MVEIKDMDFPEYCHKCRLCVIGRCAGDKDFRETYVANDTLPYRPDWCPVSEPNEEIRINSIAIFDEEEIHENCTVQVLRNSATGEVSIGWWPNE